MNTAQREIKRLHNSASYVNQISDSIRAEFNDDLTDEMRDKGIFFSAYTFEDGSELIINHNGDVYEI